MRRIMWPAASPRVCQLRAYTSTHTAIAPRRSDRLPLSETRWSGEPLEDHRHALAAAHAHCLQTEALVVELQAVQQGRGDPGPGHAERIPYRDRAAIDVQLRDVDVQVPVGRDDLGGERLVDLH